MTAGMPEEQFGDNAKTLKAVVWNPTHMGEAARQIPAEVDIAIPEIPWATILGMRNHIVHGYDVIDVGIVWNVVQDRRQPPVPILERIEREAAE